MKTRLVFVEGVLLHAGHDYYWEKDQIVWITSVKTGARIDVLVFPESSVHLNSFEKK